MMVSVPSSAFGFEPETGASRKSTTRSPSALASSRAAAGPMVDMSTASAPQGSDSAAPSSPSKIFST